ncbi:TonB-dependent receptor [Sphingomonas sp. Y38-1Y]|uniref:TonB-dependent receptor n=1 Tax=Sphingomonas sp. Y38-1Y TaxID=3078265 RepID=UPI0028E936D5|nr:TonB-dependent receptor [Sphingomonas sp. Y38-1Y]
MRRTLAGLAAAPLAAAMPAAAQEATAPDIVVTGRGLELPETRADARTEITRDRAVNTASGRLEDVLADVAGLQSFRRADSRSANPTAQGITLRGLGGNAASRALLILDGVPQADPFGGWIAFPAFSTDRIGAVRVRRGGGSGRWGSGAIGGVIEIDSATPDQLRPLTGEIVYGERDALDARATATLAREPGFATLSAGYARGDGFAPIVAEDRGPVDRAAPYEQFNAALRAVVRVAPDLELQSTVQGFTDRRDRGLDFTAIESDGADASVRLVGTGDWRFSALAYLQTRRFASQFTSVSADRTTVTPTLDQYNTPATGLGGRVELIPPLGPNVDLAIGADIRAIDGRTQELYTYVAGAPTRRREAGGATRTMGAFASLGVQAGALRIEGEGRLDGWRIADGRLFEAALTGGTLTDTRFADRSGTEATGHVGAALALNDALSLRAAAYRAWRLPTPNELYRPFRAGADATAANAELEPETMDGFEGGFDLTPARGVTLGATLFRNTLHDAIANVTVARGPGTFPGVGFVSAAGFYRRRDNLDRIRSTGVEVDARAQLGEVSLGAAYAYADAEVRGGTLAPTLDGLRPAQVPEHQASATLGWARDRWAANATVRYLGGQFEDDQNSRTLGDALTVDAVLAVPVTRTLALVGRAENLFDARVETGFSNTTLERARPRQLWVGVRFGT